MSNLKFAVAPKIKYQLHPDCVFITYDQLTIQQRKETGAGATDTVLTRNWGRARSKLLTEMASSFLGQFTSPTAYVEAVAAFARKYELDPRELFDKTLPIMEDLLFGGFAFPEGSELLRVTRPSFNVGDRVENYRIVRVIQSMADVEVYKAKSVTDESMVALKIMRIPSEAEIRNSLEREFCVLSKLDGKRNPMAESAGMWEGRYFFTSSWIDGESLDRVLLRMNSDLPDDRDFILSVLQDVIQSLTDLHEQNCLHGDIHFGNIFIRESPAGACFIDFGSAVLKGCNDEASLRSNVPFFTEPEQAARLSDGLPPPAVTEAAEQYILGAVFYYLLTGSHYAEFSHVRDKMLEQIKAALPRSFHDVGKKPWPELESVLSRALAKDPADRFPNIRDFRAALEQLLTPAIHPIAVRYRLNQPPSSDGFQEWRILEDPEAVFPLLQSPSRPIITGLAGVAYGLYRLSWLKENGEYLAHADNAIRQACSCLHQPQGQWTDTNFEMEVKSEESLYVGRSGIHLVGAIIAHARDDMIAYNESINAFDNSIKKYLADITSDGDDLFLDFNLGGVGLLMGCCLAEEHTFRRDERVLTSGDHLAENILGRIRDKTMAFGTEQPLSFGIAHGWAGVLLTLLRWSTLRSRPVDSAVVQKLESLADHYFRGDCGGASIDNPALEAHGPSWCNGAAGMVHLWLEASHSLGKDSYRDLAESAADYVWSRRQIRAGDLCCGATGWAYAFLRLFRTTGDDSWLQKSNECLRMALDSPEKQVNPLGLYKGMLGTWILTEDLRNPHCSYMPLFERP